MADNLNRALHTLMDNDPRVCVLGEDIHDPYGGAFKISRGLSSRHPKSVISTPISEAGIVGVAAGLALCGDRPVLEIMFGDFLALAFDQILNFATKSVSMYGHRIPIHLVIRCPVGGNRGYGPTHSQSPHKYLLGTPGLALFELSPFHDNAPLLSRLADRGEPCVLFENKTLYGAAMHAEGTVDDLFRFDYLDPAGEFARVFADDRQNPDVTIIAPGGMARRAVAAARELLIESELFCQIIVPSQLYPIDLAPLLPTLAASRWVCIADESPPGGTWAAEVAHQIYGMLWGRLRNRIVVVCCRDSIIPAASHLEKQVIVQSETIRAALLAATGG